MLSFPAKLRLMRYPLFRVIFSTLMVVAPTMLSASFSLLSFPIRIPRRSMRYITVPICMSTVFPEAASAMYCALTVSMCISSFRAFSYLRRSALPLNWPLRAKRTYFSSPVMPSFHFATHSAFVSATRPLHLYPPGAFGKGSLGPRLRVTSFGLISGLILPRFGFIPLPMNSPCGSTAKFPSSSL